MADPLTGAPAPGERAPGERAPGRDTDAARRRLAEAQLALLSALVADAPPPPGFDPGRLDVQRRALLAKRLGVVRKIAPEPAEILADDFRDLFLGYARGRPMTGGYRRDALDFARHLLRTDAVTDPDRVRRLTAWLAERTGPAAAPAPGRVRRRVAAVLRRLRPAR